MNPTNPQPWGSAGAPVSQERAWGQRLPELPR